MLDVETLSAISDTMHRSLELFPVMKIKPNKN